MNDDRFFNSQKTKLKIIFIMRKNYLRNLLKHFVWLLLFVGMSANGQTITSQIVGNAASSNDAQENNSTTLTAWVSLGYNNPFYSTSGLRFSENISIPQGATIGNSFITFKSNYVRTGNITLRIYAQAHPNPNVFANSGGKTISNRPKTSAYVDWEITTDWEEESDYQTVNIAPLIQELVNRADWPPSGNSIVFIIENLPNTTTTNGRYAYPSSTSNAKAPILTINYSTCSPTIEKPVFVKGATSTRCIGAGSDNFVANSANATSITYSLNPVALNAGNTINATTGAVNFVAGWSGTTIITATAQGCAGPKTSTHTINFTPAASTPVFSSYENLRCSGAGSVTYTATANGAISYEYSIVNTGSGTQPTINTSTGQVNYPANWVGQSAIKVNAIGCSNTTTATINVTSRAVFAVDDTVEVISGNEVSFDVLTNDLCSVNPSTVTIVSQPLNGLLTKGVNGNFTYVPLGNETATYTFQYQVCSTIGSNCSIATVTINVLSSFTSDPCSTLSQERIFYMPFPENTDQLHSALKSAGSHSTNSIQPEVRNISSLSVPYPSTIIIYDHWEDGYEANILKPTQATTQIWGDGILTNGIAPGTTNDLIPPGHYITFDNTFNWSRPTTQIEYDGKDKIYASNEISVTKVTGSINTFNVQNVKTNVIDTSKFGTTYVLPFGENTKLDNTRVFRYTGLFARAMENGTRITIKRPNGTTITGGTSPVLAEGEVWYFGGTASTPIGLYPADVDNANDLKAGYIVSSDKKFGVDLVFGGIDNYGTRNIPLYPAEYYSHTYYSPFYSTSSDAAAKAYFVNPNPGQIRINWTRGNGTSGYFMVPGSGGANINVFNLNVATGTKFKSQGGESFTAVVISDDDQINSGTALEPASGYDAAYTLLPEYRLTNFAKLAWAPGSGDLLDNFNPLWVTPTVTTTIYVKYNGDVTTGVASRRSPCGAYYDVKFDNVPALSSRMIFGQNNDNTGMAVFNCDNVPMAALWGQRPFDTPAGTPFGEITPRPLDVGYTVDGSCLKKMIFAQDDYATTGINTPVAINVVPNDTAFLFSLNPSTVTAISQPANGTITVNNGIFTYTPNFGFQGTDSFNYRICGSDPSGTYCDTATVFINVNCGFVADSNIISGITFMDVNKNQIADTTEFDVENVAIELYNDLNNNGILDATDTLAQTTISDTNGKYSFAVTTKVNVLDRFDVNGSTNNNGSENWAGNWTLSGATISSNRLNVNLNATSAQSLARRTVNLLGKTKAILTYKWDKSTFSADSNEWIEVQVSTNGTTYVPLYRFIGAASATGTHTFDISAYISANTTIRFIESNESVVDATNKYVRFDDIEVKSFTSKSYIVKVKDGEKPTLSRTVPLSPNYYAVTFTGSEESKCSTNFGFSTNINANNDINQTTVNVPVAGNLFTNDDINAGSTFSSTGLKVDINGDDIFETTITANGTAQTIPGVGTISVNATTGKYTFVPALNYVGEVPLIQYTITDQYGSTDSATLQIVVTGKDVSENYPPIAHNDHSVMTAGTPVIINILANDNDVDGTLTPNSVSLITTGITGVTCVNSNGDGDCTSVQVTGQGTWSVNQTTGAVTFTPVSGFTGIPTPIQYTVRDNNYSTSNTATISITLQNPSLNEFYAFDDANSGFAGSTMTGNILTNDVNPENLGTPSVSGVSVYNASGALVPVTVGIATPIYAINPANPTAYILAGTLTVNGNGDYNYVSEATYVGTANVVYNACDNASTNIACDVALYLMTVPNSASTCVKPGDFTPGGSPTKVGISVQQKQEAWPENIPNGFIALESKEKGFVITRVQNSSLIEDARIGMLIYDIDAKCVKLYNGTVWKCIEKSCND